jgi:asparagine synthase (glutamine-hydrolysing)
VSGWVGVANTDGAPLNASLLRGLTDRLRFRGPDGHGLWLEGAIGFGHTLLRTAEDTEPERQPLSLDGRVTIVGQVRIDERPQLAAALAADGHPIPAGAPDIEWVLRAYQAWGAGCLPRLRGDFAFAIWDQRTRSLLVARDPFGVRPCFYAAAPSALVFGNTLDVVLAHPGVARRLDEGFVADFLLFGIQHDPAITVFRDVARLRPGHLLSWTPGATPAVSRYASLPRPERLKRVDLRACTEQFWSLLERAVGDRGRRARVVVCMSGGLDSPSVGVARCGPGKLRSGDTLAHTVVYERLLADAERPFATDVARTLGMPIRYLAADDYPLLDGWLDADVPAPEPASEPVPRLTQDSMRAIAAWSPTALSGHGADAALYPSQLAFWKMAGGPELPRLLGHMVGHWRAVGRRPPFGGLRARLRRPPGQPPVPSWLQPDFASRTAAAMRWESGGVSFHSVAEPGCEAHRLMTSEHWGLGFERNDAGVTGVPVELAHPFFDRRVLELLLSLPAIPWTWEKRFLREALRGHVPEAVRRRPKAALPAYPAVELARAGSVARHASLEVLEPFVVPDRVPPLVPSAGPEFWLALWPRILASWLVRPRAAVINISTI